jgi:diacylglycerol kinase family enzyme
MRAFTRAGHSVRYHSLIETHWKRSLSRAPDVVVAVGGDGAVAKIAIALSKRPGSHAALTVIPAGTANNIARGLGINGTAERLAAGLDRARKEWLAIGIARGPWGKKRFVESAGIGPIASLLTVELETVRAGLSYVRHVVRSDVVQLRSLRVTADGKDLRGRYVMAQAMNIPAIGPRMELAPDADPGDTALDLVLIDEKKLPAFQRYLAQLAAGTRARAPVVAIRARRVEISPWPAHHGAHVDDKLWPHDEDETAGKVAIRIESRIPVLVP